MDLIGRRVKLTGEGWANPDIKRVQQGEVHVIREADADGTCVQVEGFSYLIFLRPASLFAGELVPVIEDLLEEMHVNVAVGIQRSTVDALERLDAMVDEMQARA